MVQASMLAAAVLIFVLHFSFGPAAVRFQRAAAVLAQPPAPHYYAPTTMAPYESSPAVPSQPFSGTVEQYYSDINSHQYAEAYALLSPTFQSTQPYAKWVNGYSDTLSASPRITLGRDPTSVSLIVAARERTADGTGTQDTIYSGAVHGVQTATGSWLIDSGYLHVVSRARQ